MIYIKLVLEKHKKWINNEEGGEHANLEDANLRCANLQGANHSQANLWGANLQDANLEDANLWGANLWQANLRQANLEVKIPPTISHCFIAEILFRESKGWFKTERSNRKCFKGCFKF